MMIVYGGEMPDHQMAFSREGRATILLTGTLGSLQYSRPARRGELACDGAVIYSPPFRWIFNVTTPPCRRDHVHGTPCAGGTHGFDPAYLACPSGASCAAQEEGTQVVFILDSSFDWGRGHTKYFATNVVCADFFSGGVCVCCASCNLSAKAVADIESAAGAELTSSVASVGLSSAAAKPPSLCFRRSSLGSSSVTCARCTRGRTGHRGPRLVVAPSSDELDATPPAKKQKHQAWMWSV